MSDTRSLHGRILTPLGWRRGHVHFDSHVRQLQVDDHSGADDLQLPVILPGDAACLAQIRSRSMRSPSFSAKSDTV